MRLPSPKTSRKPTRPYLTRRRDPGSVASRARTLPQSPPNRRAFWSERQVVVLVRQGPREVLEFVSPGPSFCLGRRGAPGRARVAAVHVATTAPTAGAEHHQLTDVDLGGVSGLVVLVLPLAVLDPALDVHPFALLQVLLDDVGKLRALGVPD